MLVLEIAAGVVLGLAVWHYRRYVVGTIVWLLLLAGTVGGASWIATLLWDRRGEITVALIAVVLTTTVIGTAWLVPWPQWATAPIAPQPLTRFQVVTLVTATLTIFGLVYVFGRP